MALFFDFPDGFLHGFAQFSPFTFWQWCQRKVCKLYIQKHLLVLNGPTTFMFYPLFP
jgi:hypothetical protein